MTTVSTLPQFTAAVNEKDATARIVVVQGIISGNTQVRIGSNKSVIGLPGAGMLINLPLCLSLPRNITSVLTLSS